MLEPGSIVRLPSGIVGIVHDAFDTPSGPRCSVRTGARTETGLEIISNLAVGDVEFVAAPRPTLGALLQAAAEADGAVAFGFTSADLDGAA